MSDVPDEILREILSRLPVAPLLRFRCVSKSWKGLIENQQFIKHHLNRTRNTNSNLNIILGTSCNIYSADLDLLNETNIATFKELSHPLKTLIPFDGTIIVGSCDGLLVLRNGRYDYTILWNPSVRRFYAIPCSGMKFPGVVEAIFTIDTCYGFGYDVVSDDYKLIKIFQFHGKDDKFNSVLEVYSLKSDSWRSFPDFPCIQDTEGVLANGAFHWIVNVKETRWYADYCVADYWVAAFDLGTEEYRLVPLPKFAVGDRINMTWSMLSVLEGCLSLNCIVKCHHAYLWVMKEYGVQESWSVLFKFDTRDFDFEFDFMGLKSYSKCGKKVLVELEFDLMWYDLDEKSFSLPLVQLPEEELFRMCTCSQSLVLLNKGTCDFDLLTRERERVIPANIGRPNGPE